MEVDALILSAQNGDEESFYQLFEHFAPMILANLNGKIGSKWQSSLSEEDVLTETFSNVYRDIRKFKPGPDSSFERWINRIAKNNLLQAIRGLSAIKRYPEDRDVIGQGQVESHFQLFGDVTGGQGSPSNAFSLKELRQFIEKALLEIPEGYASVIRLRYFEFKTTQEIAKQLGISPGAVYMREYTAKSLLQPIFRSFSQHL